MLVDHIAFGVAHVASYCIYNSSCCVAKMNGSDCAIDDECMSNKCDLRCKICVPSRPGDKCETKLPFVCSYGVCDGCSGTCLSNNKCEKLNRVQVPGGPEYEKWCECRTCLCFQK